MPRPGSRSLEGWEGKRKRGAPKGGFLGFRYRVTGGVSIGSFEGGSVKLSVRFLHRFLSAFYRGFNQVSSRVLKKFGSLGFRHHSSTVSSHCHPCCYRYYSQLFLLSAPMRPLS